MGFLFARGSGCILCQEEGVWLRNLYQKCCRVCSEDLPSPSGRQLFPELSVGGMRVHRRVSPTSPGPRTASGPGPPSLQGSFWDRL